jgi:hypothetical protein
MLFSEYDGKTKILPAIKRRWLCAALKFILTIPRAAAIQGPANALESAERVEKQWNSAFTGNYYCVAAEIRRSSMSGLSGLLHGAIRFQGDVR